MTITKTRLPIVSPNVWDLIVANRSVHKMIGQEKDKSIKAKLVRIFKANSHIIKTY